MSEYCSVYAQQCQSGCCDKYGDCPEYSGDRCYYFYSQGSKSLSRERIVMFLLIGLGVSMLLLLLWCCFKRRTKVAAAQQATAQGQYAIAAGQMQNYGGPLQGPNTTGLQINQQFIQQSGGAQPALRNLQGAHFVGEMTPAGPIAGQISAGSARPSQQFQGTVQVQGGQMISGGGVGGNPFRMTNSAILPQAQTDMVSAMNMSVAKGLLAQGQAVGSR